MRSGPKGAQRARCKGATIGFAISCPLLLCLKAAISYPPGPLRGRFIGLKAVLLRKKEGAKAKGLLSPLRGDRDALLSDRDVLKADRAPPTRLSRFAIYARRASPLGTDQSRLCASCPKGKHYICPKGSPSPKGTDQSRRPRILVTQRALGVLFPSPWGRTKADDTKWDAIYAQRAAIYAQRALAVLWGRETRCRPQRGTATQDGTRGTEKPKGQRCAPERRTDSETARQRNSETARDREVPLNGGQTARDKDAVIY